MHRPPHPQSPRSVGPAPVRNDSERYGSSAAVVSRGPLSGCQSSPAISVGAGPTPAGVLPTPRRAARPGWSPPKSAFEKDLLIEKLVHDNEVLMREVAELDAQLRQTMGAKDDALRTNAELLEEKQERESVSQVSERLLHSMNAQVEMVRAEREEHSRQHAADKEYLREIFTALEAQLSVVRSEREELQSRADRERRASARRIKELEDSLAVAIATKERMREECGALMSLPCKVTALSPLLPALHSFVYVCARRIRAPLQIARRRSSPSILSSVSPECVSSATREGSISRCCVGLRKSSLSSSPSRPICSHLPGALAPTHWASDSTIHDFQQRSLSLRSCGLCGCVRLSVRRADARATPTRSVTSVPARGRQPGTSSPRGSAVRTGLGPKLALCVSHWECHCRRYVGPTDRH